jgi:hypothetical protein
MMDDYKPSRGRPKRERKETISAHKKKPAEGALPAEELLYGSTTHF